MTSSKLNKYGVKNPYYYKCEDTQLKLYRVYGPGISKSGNNITICDIQTAEETVQEMFKVYMAGWLAGRDSLARKF